MLHTFTVTHPKHVRDALGTAGTENTPNTPVLRRSAPHVGIALETILD